MYLHPNVDLSAYRRVAVLPLDNLSTDRFAADRVREILVVELSAARLFEVVETGEVNRVLRSFNLGTAAELGPADIAAIGQELGVEGLLAGTVMEYGERRTGTFTAPDVALSLHLLDVETGISAWSVTDARTGLGLWTRLFGVGEMSRTEVVQDLIRSLVSELLSAAGAT